MAWPTSSKGGTARGGGRPARLLALRHEPDVLASGTRHIHGSVLRRSRHVRDGNFKALGLDDLQLLFGLYDATFFNDLLTAMLREDGADLTFRLSSRMTRVGGTTTMRRPRGLKAGGPAGRVGFEITVSTALLFESFRDAGRSVAVSGLTCNDRLEALQRVFEHELLHLAEFLAWGRSSCSEATFLELSRNIFGHAGVKHELVTPRETAASMHGIRIGDRVVFEHLGVLRNGLVNRVTKRATVLVEDPAGRPFSDGRKYATFYVPVAMLRKDLAPG